MRWNLLTQPLGTSVSNSYVLKKEMPLPLAIPIGLAVAGLASSIFGGVKSAKEAQRAQSRLNQEKATNEAERTRKKYETWTSTASGRNTLRMLADQAKQYAKTSQGAAAVGGTTHAADQAEKELQVMKQAEVIAQAEANHEARKEQADASYRQQQSALNQQQSALDQQKAANISQVFAGASNGLMQGAMSTFAGTKLGQSWMGGQGAGGQTKTSPLSMYSKNYGMLSNNSPLYNSKVFWNL